MSYGANTLIDLGGKPCFVLLDQFGQKNKRYITVGDALKPFVFYSDFSDIANIRRRYPKAGVYGFWHLLHFNRKIDLKPEKGAFVVYKPESKNGFYFFYDKQKSEFITGVVLKGKAIGAFAYNVSEAIVLEVETESLKLPEAVLLPAERRKQKVVKYQKQVLKNIIIASLVAIGFFFLNLSLNSLTVEEMGLRSELNRLQSQKRLFRDKLSILKRSHYEVKKISRQPKMLKPLFVIAHTNTKDVKIKTMLFTAKRFSFKMKEAKPWMNGLLESKLFTLTEDKKKGRTKETEINIEWKSK
jgi:hypothetical protein